MRNTNESKDAEKKGPDGFYYAVVLFCIFSFKLILIGVGESGIRADDILILVAAFVFAVRGDFRAIPITRSVKFYLLFVGIGFASAIWNAFQGRVSLLISLFFVIRLLQYMFFYFLGYRIAAAGHTLKKAITAYLWLMALVVPLQMVGIVPVPGNFIGITSRAVGNSNGPYELAVIAAFMLCFLGYYCKSWIKGSVSAVLVLLAASRITFAAMIVSLALTYLRKSQTRLQYAFLLLLLLVPAGIVYSLMPSGENVSGNVELAERVSEIHLAEVPSEFSRVYSYIPTYQNSKDYYDGEFVEATNQAETAAGDAGDISGMIRLFRWASLIKSTLAHTDSIILGLGPSFGTSAVDGYYVRLFAETGLLGLGSFLAFAYSLWLGKTGSTWPFREYAFMVFASCCFVDIGVSYKPMLLLWLWHGMQQAKPKEESETGGTPVKLIPPLQAADAAS